MKNIDFLWIIVCVFFSLGNALAQNDCSSSEKFSVLDFWVGEWEVYVGDTMVGKNHIYKIIGDCAVREEWTSMSGGTGQSLFYYHPDSETWKQVWITENPLQPGGTKEKNLVENDPGVRTVFQGEYMYQNRMIQDRTILEKITADEVSQVIQVSFDEGNSWRDTFNAVYKRVKF